MIFEPDELAVIRDTFRDSVPTYPADIAVWLAASGLASQRDHLVVDLAEWHATPDLSVPAWHVGSLGALVDDIHGWAGRLFADGHLTKYQVMLQARAAAITALARMAGVHEALAARWSGPRRTKVLGRIEHATTEARNVLGDANTQLETYLAGVPYGTPGRATAARSTTAQPRHNAHGSAPATEPPPQSSPARRR